MKSFFVAILFLAIGRLYAQHNFSVENKRVLWERHYKTSEKDVLEQLGKVKKLHFLQETSGNGLNIKYPCEMILGIEVNFDFKFTIVVRETGYLVSVREITFEESEDQEDGGSRFDNMVLRFNRKELSKSKAALATMECMDGFFTKLFKTTDAVPQ